LEQWWSNVVGHGKLGRKTDNNNRCYRYPNQYEGAPSNPGSNDSNIAAYFSGH